MPLLYLVKINVELMQLLDVLKKWMVRKQKNYISDQHIAEIVNSVYLCVSRCDSNDYDYTNHSRYLPCSAV